jgi:hypothetical protein
MVRPRPHQHAQQVPLSPPVLVPPVLGPLDYRRVVNEHAAMPSRVPPRHGDRIWSRRPALATPADCGHGLGQLAKAQSAFFASTSKQA